MENTQEQKTPEQWFQMLKEPYRSEAIKNINTEYTYYEKTTKSLKDAIQFSFDWLDSRQRHTYWSKIYNSIRKGETTYLETETLKPGQMESGKWYVVVDNNNYKWLIKFNFINENEKVFIDKYCYDLTDGVDRTDSNNSFCFKEDIKLIRPATKDKVLKYFPDEVLEPIELRPEDLVSGEVYRAFCDAMKVHRIFSFNKLMNGVWYYKMRNYTGEYHNNSYLADTFKFYHATPEEKALLLGEEKPTDWEAKYNELKAKYEKLSTYNDELTERINKTETKNNQEKVYFYFNRDMEKIESAKSLDEAKINSEECHPIYEAIKIGVKKSVLVNE